MSLEGKVALVAGVTRGAGRGIPQLDPRSQQMVAWRTGDVVCSGPRLQSRADQTRRATFASPRQAGRPGGEPGGAARHGLARRLPAT